MFDLALPMWLLGLALIPLIRWLHRWRAPLTRAPVNALFLWRGAADTMEGSEQRRAPDPAWRRRALIASLVVLALANPFLLHDDARLTVWIDDSLSMATVEDGRSRLAMGLEQLREAIAERGNVDVTLRSLGNRASSISANDPRAFDESYWLTYPQLAADPPPQALMAADSEHWLVSDGAGSTVSDWSRSAPLARILTVGYASENASVNRLAARRSTTRPGTVDVLVTVTNRGRDEARRNLVLASPSGTTSDVTLTIAAGKSATSNFTLTTPHDELVASLLPGDALAVDDSIKLDIAQFGAVPAHVDDACPAALQQAIDAHIGLLRVPEANAATLQILCSNVEPLAAHVVRFHRDQPVPIDAIPAWLPAAGSLQNLQLPRAWTSVSRWPVGQPSGDLESILVAGDDILAAYSNESPLTIETVVDLANADFVIQPEYAVFVAGLVDLALGRPVLDPVASVEREPRESDIAPEKLTGTASLSPGLTTSRSGISDLLLALAIVILLLDLLLLWRAKRESRNV